ncbi:hypothetical protein DC522_06130 [Microvirga sp. KLBC 81]|uniref:hypothetical protein n=1 Tax=Microvirga sp. KLBC 81 TaxID=1862707 RepID=UPI000D51A80F|nr:hypothetical protein [Microvirga sp. KLBC 81]PVE25471.1 hypothetical protein DC522_06130 [Microvirga sp. KLBC 81]
MHKVSNPVKHPKKRWSKTHAVYLGAVSGMGIAIAHQVYHAAVGEIPDESPLAHILPEFIGLVAGGALLLAAIAEVRNRL